MRKVIFLLILIFPNLIFGQSFTGNYRAIFFNPLSEPKTIVAEFEVKSDNSIIGKIKVGDEVKIFNGTVEKKGKFEISTEKDGNSVYKLKGKFDKENKISFVQRVEKGSGLNKSVSENGFEGNFSKVAIKTESEKESPPPEKEIELIDNGKSQLAIQFSLPLFGNEWKDFVGKVAYADSKDGRQLEFTANGTVNGKKLSLRIRTKAIRPNQKLWKTTDLQIATYREEIVNSTERALFLTAEHIYQTNPQLQNGTLEIISETDKQIVFKLKKIRIKRFAKEDFVVLNGFVYVEK